MTNQEFQDILASLPAGFNVIINGTPFFDVIGSFETREGAIKGTIHITDTFAAKFNKTTTPVIGKTEKSGTGLLKKFHTAESMIDSIRSGMSQDDFMEKFKVSKRTFYYYKKLHSPEKSIKPKKAAKKHSERLSDLYRHKAEVRKNRNKIMSEAAAGVGFEALREKYGISKITYGRYIKEIRKNDPPVSGPAHPLKSENMTNKFLDNKEEASPAAKKPDTVDINNIQEKMHDQKSFGPLSANPEVRDWQKDMIVRGL